MSNLEITARLKIHNGQLEEFKKLAEECLSLVKAKDKDTLQYDWYFDEKQTECVVRETYPDSNALLAHIGNLGEVFGKLLALGDFSLEIYGQPSDELLKALSGLKFKVYNFFQGL
jgi:quinol monooxygenase YgiN